MKKIMLLLFLFFLCLSCYYIYKVTEVNTINITSIGDSIADIKAISNLNNLNKYNNTFISKDYRIIDLLNIIKYNEETKIKDKDISIHQVLKNSNVLIISIGMNDIYYKINDNTKEIYTYVNNLIAEYEELLTEINKYHYDKVIVLGYYNIQNKNNDIFTYTNYKLKKLVDKYNYTFINLNNYLYNNSKYLLNDNYFYLNNEGYNQIFKLIVEKI